MTEKPRLFERAAQQGTRTAVVDADGRHGYDRLLDTSARVAASLLAGSTDLDEARIAFLVPPGFDYVAAQWGIWRAGGVAVPLAPGHPPAELAYVLDDARPAAVVAHPEWTGRVGALAAARSIRLLDPRQAQAGMPASLPKLNAPRRAMILYTSGSTGKPKGVVTTHANVQAQVESLVQAWEWSAQDRILNVLPLHHVHGIVNVVTCALWAGAVCEFAPRFDAAQVWSRFAQGDLTLFMGVPTIYSRLIAAWDRAPSAQREAMAAGCARMRLMVSGSAALPVETWEAWRAMTGHALLERYGMTEIGMALSNPYRGRRVPGHVGSPLPGVHVRLVDEAGRDVPPGTPGEIEVQGPGVFREYWGRPETTRLAFRDGWFRTGDVAVIEGGSYRILGRQSVDIIKTGGYKVSALEVEQALQAHPDIRECAVVGVPDATWGECVSACVALRQGAALSLDSMRAWARERLAAYKIPQRLLVAETLPRNAMGKVQKPAVARLFRPVP